MKLKQEYIDTTLHLGSPLGISIQSSDIPVEDYPLYNSWYPFLFETDLMDKIKKHNDTQPQKYSEFQLPPLDNFGKPTKVKRRE